MRFTPLITLVALPLAFAAPVAEAEPAKNAITCARDPEAHGDLVCKRYAAPNPEAAMNAVACPVQNAKREASPAL